MSSYRILLFSLPILVLVSAPEVSPKALGAASRTSSAVRWPGRRGLPSPIRPRPRGQTSGRSPLRSRRHCPPSFQWDASFFSVLISTHLHLNGTVSLFFEHHFCLVAKGRRASKQLFGCSVFSCSVKRQHITLLLEPLFFHLNASFKHIFPSWPQLIPSSWNQWPGHLVQDPSS